VPHGVLQLLSMPGLKPEKALRLHRDLGISSLAELEEAAKTDRVKKAKGLGAALQTKILQNLAIARSGAGKLHIHRAAALLENAAASLKAAQPKLKRVTVAGDFRRGCELVGDMSIVAEAPASRDAGGGAVGEGLDVRFADRKRFAAALLFATGSAAHLEGLRALAKAKGFRLDRTACARAAARSRRRRRTSTERSACPTSSLKCAKAAARSSGR
jgi:DNA polymerase (family X)